MIYAFELQEALDTTLPVYTDSDRDWISQIYETHDGVLARKFIYGPRVDEMVCMIDVADSGKVYYYHYDGLGSVAALSDSYGTSAYSYEYGAYGRVRAEDLDFTANPYMFTGRRFDYETVLYYYRARSYNPYIGRFLQTDPVCYNVGMNLYAYCENNPIGMVDPSGLYHLVIKWIKYVPDSPLEIAVLTDEGGWRDTRAFGNLEDIELFFDDWGDSLSGEDTFALYIIEEDAKYSFRI